MVLAVADLAVSNTGSGLTALIERLTAQGSRLTHEDRERQEPESGSQAGVTVRSSNLLERRASRLFERYWIGRAFASRSYGKIRRLWLRQWKGTLLMHSCGRVGRLACVLALGVLGQAVSPPGAHAQSPLPPAGSLDVAPFLGFTFGSDQEGATTTLGVGVGYNLTEQIAVEGELGIVPDIEGDISALDISVFTFSANGVYHFDTGTPYVPYATFGLGFGRASFDIPDGDDDSSTEFAINVGGGVKRAITEKIAWRADLRYFNVNDDNPNFWRVYGGVTFHFNPR
jgi:hypothetical protein